jgi:hypothetical protein
VSVTPARDLARGWNLPADQVAIEFSEHSIEQFAERVRRLDPDGVKRELCRLLRGATVSRQAPDWVNVNHDSRPNAYLIVGSDLVLPLYRHGHVWTAATALTPHFMPESKREKRTQASEQPSEQRGSRRPNGTSASASLQGVDGRKAREVSDGDDGDRATRSAPPGDTHVMVPLCAPVTLWLRADVVSVPASALACGLPPPWPPRAGKRPAGAADPLRPGVRHLTNGGRTEAPAIADGGPESGAVTGAEKGEPRITRSGPRGPPKITRGRGRRWHQHPQGFVKPCSGRRKGPGGRFTEDGGDLGGNHRRQSRGPGGRFTEDGGDLGGKAGDVDESGAWIRARSRRSCRASEVKAAWKARERERRAGRS